LIQYGISLHCHFQAGVWWPDSQQCCGVGLDDLSLTSLSDSDSLLSSDEYLTSLACDSPNTLEGFIALGGVD
jgi:hypothetical protein